MCSTRHETNLPVLYLRLRPDCIEIAATLDVQDSTQTRTFRDWVKPGESFGGFSYDELLEIARTTGQIDADELKV